MYGPYRGLSYGQEDLKNRNRSGLREIISAFRTVSTDAAMLIAGIMPLKLVVNVESGIGFSHSVQLVGDAKHKWQQD